ncbi:hypothetical protein [Lewinella sp. W8]|uniref:hypothetical protein n=1 Tax=Lewinella sp. W8 TaxID=2528208 RepID=UPI001067A173|nr:hypothetical protein [Lewinella sp. W8]MTB53739.1 hypothetical protein [Lewinella sp. W8]
MFFRIIIPLLLIGGLTSTAAMAQGNPCADLVKNHLATLDQHLDLDFKQMKCLKDKATAFCDKNRQNPPQTAAQKDKRVNAFRKAILECLDARQRQKVITHFKDKRDERARRNLLDAFIQEFGDEVIIIKKRS